MITIQHRSSPGRLDSMWEFDSERGVIEAVIRLGGTRAVGFTVPVCAPDKPRLWSHPIMRLDSVAWRILPAVWVVSPSSVVGRPPKLVPSECSRREGTAPCALHEAIGAGSHLVLTGAPSDIDIEIVELDL